MLALSETTGEQQPESGLIRRFMREVVPVEDEGLGYTTLGEVAFLLRKWTPHWFDGPGQAGGR
jgi:hypothetical protein